MTSLVPRKSPNTRLFRNVLVMVSVFMVQVVTILFLFPSLNMTVFSLMY